LACTAAVAASSSVEDPTVVIGFQPIVA
jgi:hypothetical protein